MTVLVEVSLRVAVVVTLLAAVGFGPATAADSAVGDPSPACLGEAVTIQAQPGEKTFGTRGPDVIGGTNGPDIIFAGDGRDRVCGNGGRDRIYGGPGALGAQIFSQVSDRLSGGPGRDVLYGGKGSDILRGGTGKDELHGGRHFDDFILFGGGDTVFGGPGDVTDTISYAHADRGVSVDLRRGTARLTGSAVIEHLHGIENVTGSPFDDVLLGNAKPNNLDGGYGDDVIDEGPGYSGLLGGPGDDVIRGGDDTDEIEGGPGDDYIDGGNGDDYVEDGGGSGKDICVRAEFHNCEIDLSR